VLDDLDTLLFNPKVRKRQTKTVELKPDMPPNTQRPRSTDAFDFAASSSMSMASMFENFQKSSVVVTPPLAQPRLQIRMRFCQKKPDTGGAFRTPTGFSLRGFQRLLLDGKRAERTEVGQASTAIPNYVDLCRRAGGADGVPTAPRPIEYRKLTKKDGAKKKKNRRAENRNVSRRASKKKRTLM
jgi:hypothetical protein